MIKELTVQLFVTCILDTPYPKSGEAVVEVLERAGVHVEFPCGQTCYGKPAFNAGVRVEARRMAMHTIRAFESTPGPVLVPSGSWTAMIRRGYAELFASDAEWLPRAQALASRFGAGLRSLQTSTARSLRPIRTITHQPRKPRCVSM